MTRHHRRYPLPSNYQEGMFALVALSVWLGVLEADEPEALKRSGAKAVKIIERVFREAQKK